MKAPAAVSYQGERGSNSAEVCTTLFPGSAHLACTTFEDALDALADGKADYAVIPIENSSAGRVADVHHLLPGSGLFVVAETFLPIHFQLAGVPGAGLATVRSVHSHIHALGQCRQLIRARGWATTVAQDTAGAAREVAERGDRTVAALCPAAAVAMHGLELLAADVEDEHHNTTRFIVLAREPIECPVDDGPAMTSLLFRVKNLPGSLHHALGGFAENDVNVTKLESYQLGGTIQATQFFADIEGHREEPRVADALAVLRGHAAELRILGSYPAHAHRARGNGPSA